MYLIEFLDQFFNPLFPLLLLVFQVTGNDFIPLLASFSFVIDMSLRHFLNVFFVLLLLFVSGGLLPIFFLLGLAIHTP